MSLITKTAGIDPLIAAIRKNDWKRALLELRGVVRKYGGASAAAGFGLFLAAIGISEEGE